MDIANLLDMNINGLAVLANQVRKDNVGDVVHIRGLLEISNICLRNCAYCGLRAENSKLTRYKMPFNQIESVSQSAIDIGYKTIVMQGGENKSYDIARLADSVAKLSEQGVAITLSLGELEYSEFELLKKAGAKRYLLKFETADNKMYAKLHNGYCLNKRIDALRALRELGYEVGSGFLVGLPDENRDVLIKNLQLLKDLECDMAGIGVFIPHKDTPLASASEGDYLTTVKCLAITRLLLPKCNIPITTSLGELGDKYAMFNCGANVIMINITPHNLAKKYQIYPKKTIGNDLLYDRQNVEKIIRDYGRIPL